MTTYVMLVEETIPAAPPIVLAKIRIDLIRPTRIAVLNGEKATQIDIEDNRISKITKTLGDASVPIAPDDPLLIAFDSERERRDHDSKGKD